LETELFTRGAEEVFSFLTYKKLALKSILRSGFLEIYVTKYKVKIVISRFKNKKVR